MEVAAGLPRRGKTWFDGSTPPTTFQETTNLEGTLRRFDDDDPASNATGTGAKVRLTGAQVICRLVRNVSGITLNAKRVVKWKAGFRLRRVDGYVTIDHEEAAGVVDSFYSTGIVANDLGWVVVSGPCLVKTSLGADATNVITEGDVLTALTGATSQSTTSGRVQAAAATSNQTNGVSIALNRIGRAMSAKTTANTNADVLVDVMILRAA